jgi:primosomal protein N' (replication factor Y)
MGTAGGTETIPAVPDAPALVVATPGAEPAAAAGYAAAVLLDGWVLLGRPGLRAAEEALRRWMNAAALVVSAAAGGAVAIVADAGFPTVQALVRWDPVTHSEWELSERAELRFPPAVRMAAITGPAEGVRALLDAASLPGQAEVLGCESRPAGAGARRVGRAGPHAGAGAQASRPGAGPRTARRAGRAQRAQGRWRRPGPARPSGADLSSAAKALGCWGGHLTTEPTLQGRATPGRWGPG